MDTTLTTLAEPSLSSEQVFTCFPKLPVEIRDMIWDLSMTGHVREFRFVDPTYPQSERAMAQTSLVRQSTQDHPLFRTCKSSRARAMIWRTGHSYHVEVYNRLHVCRSTPVSIHHHLHFDYDPTMDTIYVPHYYELHQLSLQVKLGRWSWEGHKPCTEMKSLALGGIFEKAFYNHDFRQDLRGDFVPVPSGTDWERIQIDTPYSFWYSWNLLTFLPLFSSLEELIIIIPPVDRIAALCAERSETSRGPEYECAMRSNLGFLEQDMQRFKDMLERLMPAPPHPYVAPLQQDKVNSKWWDKPKVTFMTEAELFARSGTERKHGTDSMLAIRQIFETARSSKPVLYDSAPDIDWKQLLEDVGELDNVRALGFQI